MNLSINNTYTTPTNPIAKINGRQQTVMSANFADMLNANMATSTKPTTATTSTDKVTLSSPATQATAQDDIESEAQTLVKRWMDDPLSQQGVIFLTFGCNGDLTSDNSNLMSKLRKESESMRGSPAMNSPEFKKLNLMMSTLGAFGDKQNFTRESLGEKAKVYERYWEIMADKVGADKIVRPF